MKSEELAAHTDLLTSVSTQMLVAPRATPEVLTEIKEDVDRPVNRFGQYVTP